MPAGHKKRSPRIDVGFAVFPAVKTRSPPFNVGRDEIGRQAAVQAAAGHQYAAFFVNQRIILSPPFKLVGPTFILSVMRTDYK